MLEYLFFSAVWYVEFSFATMLEEENLKQDQNIVKNQQIDFVMEGSRHAPYGPQPVN